MCCLFSGSGPIGPRRPAGGGSHSGRVTSHAKLLDASSGTFSFGETCAEADAAQAAMLRQNAPASALCHALRTAGLAENPVHMNVAPCGTNLRTPHAGDRGNVAVLL